MDRVADLLFALRTQGIQVWSDKGRLRYHSSNGALAPEDLERLRALKPRILEFLQASPAHTADPPLAPRPHSDRAPLTFSQRWFWNIRQLETRSSMRSVAGAVRLSGRLNIETLRGCFVTLVRRHEALRSRIVAQDGIPEQCIDAAADDILEICDLTPLPAAEREIQLERLVKQIIYEPLSVAAGPLFAARLLKLVDCNHVLVVAMDHMISDGASLGILWREILTLYEQSIHGRAQSLPSMSIQFADYALWQQATQQSWTKKHAGYWTQRLAGARCVRLSADGEVVESGPVKWAVLPVRLGESASLEIRDFSRREHTTPVMTVFTAYCASILRWAETSDVVVPFLTIGRLRPEIAGTLGFFGHPLFLRVQLLEQDSLLDLLARVTREYGAAYEHDDEARIAAQLPTPQFVWNPSFSWNPQEFSLSGARCPGNAEPDDALAVEQLELEITPREDIRWEAEPRLDLSDTAHGVIGTLRYRTDRYSVDAMQRFERSFRLFAQKLVEQPHARVTTLSCES
jgi:hypothetical protein